MAYFRCASVEESGGEEIALTSFNNCTFPSKCYSDEGVTEISIRSSSKAKTSDAFSESKTVEVTITEVAGVYQYSWTAVGAKGTVNGTTVAYNAKALGSSSWVTRSESKTYTYRFHVPEGFCVWIAKFNTTGINSNEYKAITV